MSDETDIPIEMAKSYSEVRRRIERREKRHGGSVRFRGHSLSPEKLAELTKKWDAWQKGEGEFPSPYSDGIRTDHLRALVKLGVNRPWHLGRDVKPVLKKIMQETGRWKRFESSKRGDRILRSDVTERILDNFRSFRRLCKKEGRVGEGGWHPYGMKLWQMGCCVDIFTIRKLLTSDTGERSWSIERYIRFNTKSRVPVAGPTGEISCVEDIRSVE